MRKIFIPIFFLIPVVLHGQTITEQPLTQLTYCSGDSGTVSYRSTGTFNASNVFEVQLSDSEGDFNSWTILGRSSAAADSIRVAFTQTGTFRVRVVSTDPVVSSSDNGSNIDVATPPVPNVYVVAENGLTMFAESGLANNVIDVQDDSLQFFDQYDDSAIRHEWTFNQDANISSSTLANPTVIWGSGGSKTGGLRTWNREGCTDSVSLSLQLETCNPVIPSDAHIVTGTESGDYQDVWVKPGGVYTGGAGKAFLEPGSEMEVQNLGGATVDRVYVKRGASFVIASNENVYVADLDTGASFKNNGNVGYILHCDSLQFDYSNFSVNRVENLPQPTVTFRQLGGHLFVDGNEKPTHVRMFSLLGNEILAADGSGTLDLDLSLLPTGVYFAVVQAGGGETVRKIAIMH